MNQTSNRPDHVVEVATGYSSAKLVRLSPEPRATTDKIANEAPLAIRYTYSEQPDETQNLTTLLRTPGDDHALVAGFMFNEGHLRAREQLEWMHHCQDDDSMLVFGKPKLSITMRHHLTHAGCGACSLEQIDNLFRYLSPVCGTDASGKVAPELTDLVIQITTSQLRRTHQPLFDLTGGVHATLLFDRHSTLLSSAEDVGRHNALDKAIGKLWLDEKLDHAHIAWVSGRLGFELVQKSISAGINAIVAVGAPSSLALHYAHSFGLAVFAFARDSRVNFYPPDTSH